ncbi:hypothetical protein [uncultured Methanomethylovorans sp.]|uniref:hypothetical protein n=1 Tax=uncultured Methanomethylovorans sp. TaxID=183759 RepID=UPI002AA7D7BF|nr:hypothetical protein [uncultured Methanomethylovorans sp.]
MKLITYVAVMLLLFGVLSTDVLAAYGQGNGNNAIGNQGNEAKNQERDQNQISVTDSNDTDNNRFYQKLRDTKREYFSAKEKLHQLNANISSGKVNISSKEVFDVRQEYLLETIDYTISSLEDLETKVNASQREDADVIIAEIDEYVSELNAEKNNVQNATTTKELAKSARNIHNIWKDAVKHASKTRARFVDDKVGIYLNKSTSLSERLSKEIEQLQQQGKDTTEFDKLLQEYNDLISEAQQNRGRAKEAYENSDATTSTEYWNAAAENLKDANSVLAEMSQNLRAYRQGVVSLNGDDILIAKGNGTVVLSGDLESEMTINTSQLVIKDLAGDAKIMVINNEFTSVLQLDNSQADDPKKALVYSDLTGKVTISGSRLTIMVRGNNLDLKVEGTGNAVLSGEGTYTVGTDEDSKQWASQFDIVSEEDDSQEE